jgi:gluconolactonase
MPTRRVLLALLFIPAFAAAVDAPPIPGIGPVGPVVKVHGGFGFTEGPAPDRHGNLYFSDIPKNRIHKLDAAGKLTVFRENSNSSNGLMVNAKGEIVACEMKGQVVALSPDGKERRVLAAEYNGVRFNAPNDLVIDRSGGIYFTDPEYGAPKPWPQKIRTFYYLAPDGKVTRLLDEDLPNPNGIILSPDETTLYVFPTGDPKMLAFAVKSPGVIADRRVFCTLKLPEGKKSTGGADGVTIDTKGNVYVTSELGVQVFDPSGKYLGVIQFPEQPANCEFGGPDMKTLYATARTSLYAVPMEAQGHRFATGK